jgi:hypothetical protein
MSIQATIQTLEKQIAAHKNEIVKLSAIIDGLLSLKGMGIDTSDIRPAPPQVENEVHPETSQGTQESRSETAIKHRNVGGVLDQLVDDKPANSQGDSRSRDQEIETDICRRQENNHWPRLCVDAKLGRCQEDQVQKRRQREVHLLDMTLNPLRRVFLSPTTPHSGRRRGQNFLSRLRTRFRPIAVGIARARRKTTGFRTCHLGVAHLNRIIAPLLRCHFTLHDRPSRYAFDAVHRPWIGVLRSFGARHHHPAQRVIEVDPITNEEGFPFADFLAHDIRQTLAGFEFVTWLKRQRSDKVSHVESYRFQQFLPSGPQLSCHHVAVLRFGFSNHAMNSINPVADHPF